MELGAIFGRDQHTILWWQMADRAGLVFVYALVILRLAGRRIFGKSSSLDIVVSILLGSTLSRTLTGNSPLGSTLTACTVLIVLHYALGKLASASPGAAKFLKGTEIQLATRGNIDWDSMHRHNLTGRDLLESLRIYRGQTELTDIDAVFLERNGQLSVITKSHITTAP